MNSFLTTDGRCFLLAINYRSSSLTSFMRIVVYHMSVRHSLLWTCLLHCIFSSPCMRDCYRTSSYNKHLCVLNRRCTIFVCSWTNKAGTEGRKASTPVPLPPSPNMFGTQALLAALSTPFKRSQLGLFHGKMRQSGNNVPFSKHKTKRTWLPNVQQKRLHSDVLGENVKLKLTTRALKTIKKVSCAIHASTSRFLTGSVLVQCGGLDNYLLNTRADLLGQEGMRLRVLIREQRNMKVLENAQEVPRAL